MTRWYLYLLECAGGVLYTGITTDPGRRFSRHAAGKGAAFTRANPPVRMLAAEEFPDRASATRAEIALKRLRRGLKLRWAAERRLGEAGAPTELPGEMAMTDEATRNPGARTG